MFDDWKKRREYQTKIAANEKALRAVTNETDPDGQKRNKLRQTLFQQRQNFEIFESEHVIRKAHRRAIDLPSRRDKPDPKSGV